MTDYELHAAVNAGMAVLDEVMPDWWQPSCASPIDLDTLNLGSFVHCVVGQLFCVADRITYTCDGKPTVDWPSWSMRAFNHLGHCDRRWLAAHGFYPPNDIYQAWAIDATAIWREGIVQRRTKVI